MRKKVLAVILLIALMFGSGIAGYAVAERPIDIIVNGNTLFLPTVQPMIVDGTVMVPLSAIVPDLGKVATWDPETRTVIINDDHWVNKKPPKITGPDEFVQDVQGALDLLREKDVNTYEWVIGNIEEIIFDENADQALTAYTDAYSGKVYIVKKDYEACKKVYKERYSDIAWKRLILSTLAHESAHTYIEKGNFDKMKNQYVEAMCNLAALSVIEAAGADSNSPEWQVTKKQTLETYLKW